MLILPILAFAVRTLRSSTEVGRSASLYHAKRDALVDFKFQLVNEIERNPRNWEKIVKILWECENHLEEVNREWVRIMKEASPSTTEVLAASLTSPLSETKNQEADDDHGQSKEN